MLYGVFVKTVDDSQYGEGWDLSIEADSESEAEDKAVIAIEKAIEQQDCGLVANAYRKGDL